MAGRTDIKTVTRSVRSDWKGDLRSEAHVRDCPPFFTDEPKGRGGLFEFPTPAEYIVSGLAGCSVAHAEMFAKEVGMPFEDIHVDGRLTMGHFDPDDERSRAGGILGIELDIEIVSSGSLEELERVKALFREKCVLYLFAKAAVPVVDEWTLARPG